MAAYDFPGNFRTVELLGAKPVLADVSHEPTIPMFQDAISPTICPQQLEAAASPLVRAVIASHLHGNQADMKRSCRQTCDQNGWITDRRRLPSHRGYKLMAKPLGHFGHLATLSFGGSKLISAGSGGAIIANDERLAARLGWTAGSPRRHLSARALSKLQSSDPQLDRLDELTHIRNLTARFLTRTSISRIWNNWDLTAPPRSRHTI